MSEWNQETQQRAIQTVFDRSSADAGFLQELVANPRDAVQEATGLILPDGIRL